jgi:glycogen(starch) synthase
MRVLMLSWEYPPVMVGGLGRHVHALATALAAAGHEVTVVTRHRDGSALQETVDGVRVVRVPEDPPKFPLATETLLAWTMAFNHALTRTALKAVIADEYDVVHAHDWLVAHTAVALSELLEIPLVATIHATEAGRHQGWLPGELSRGIHSVECWLAHRARRVLVCSGYMRWEVTRVLGPDPSTVEVIPNGVDAHAWRAPRPAVTAARSRFAGAGPLLGYAGRLVYEKGVQDLVGALPELRRRHPGLRLVIAGEGPYRSALQEQAWSLNLHRAVCFTGFVGADLPAVFAASNAVVVPSIYEPFGMVALEAACAGAPLAVAATGGLAEIVEPGVTGVTFPAKDPGGLARAVGTLLADRAEARRMARRALTMVYERYTWSAIAARTVQAYRTAMAAPAPADSGLEIVIPDGNLLAGTDNLMA